MTKHPTRRELLGLDKVKETKERKVREKSVSEKVASLTKKLEQIQKRYNRAAEAYGKESRRLQDTTKELQAICPHKSTKTELLTPGDMDFESPFYEAKVCKACRIVVSQKSIGR